MASKKAHPEPRKPRKTEQTEAELMAELKGLMESAAALMAEPSTEPSMSPRKRLARLKKALSAKDAFESLVKIRELVPDEGVGAQQVVVYGFACILETSSACLSILFDRFDDDELAKIVAALESIGATSTLRDLRELQVVFARAVGKGHARLDAADRVARQARTRGVDGRSEAHGREMEQKLLEFCKQHLEELAAGSS
jgi:hypothetical protein